MRWVLGAVLICGCSLDQSGLGGGFEDLPVDDSATFEAGGSSETTEPDVAIDTAIDTSEPETTTDVAADEVVETAPPCTGVTFGGHCYWALATALSFADAKSACAAAGAHLASITSTAEQSVVETIGAGDRWVGLERDATAASNKSAFHWTTGEPGTLIDNWDVGEPNGTGPCARLHPNGKWADWTCDSTLTAICEHD